MQLKTYLQQHYTLSCDHDNSLICDVEMVLIHIRPCKLGRLSKKQSLNKACSPFSKLQNELHIIYSHKEASVWITVAVKIQKLRKQRMKAIASDRHHFKMVTSQLQENVNIKKDKKKQEPYRHHKFHNHHPIETTATILLYNCHYYY